MSHVGPRHCLGALALVFGLIVLAGWPGRAPAQSDKDAERADSEAVRKLEPLVPQIRAGLQSENPDARRAAFVAVGDLPRGLDKYRLSDMLGAVLQKGIKDPDILAVGLHSYGKSRPSATEIPKVLGPHVQSEDVAVRRAAAEALAILLANAVPPNKYLKEAEPFIGAATQALPLVAKALDNPDPETQRPALQGLTATVSALSDLYKNESRSGPGEEPKGKGPGGPLAPLEPVVREVDRVLPKLAGPLAAEDPTVRTAASKVLDGIGALRASILAARPGDPEPFSGGLKEAFPALSDRVNDPDPGVRLAAVEAIETLDVGVDGGPTLVRATSDPSVFVRWTAARALGKLSGVKPDTAAPDPRVRALARLAGDRDLDVRNAALLALAKYGTAAKSAVPEVLGAAVRGDVEPRLSALKALAALESDAESTVPVLIEDLRYRDFRLRRAAASGLVRFGPKARPALDELRDALASTDPELRLAAAEAVLAIEVRAKPRED
ncbi:MAG TPA: HEAT repeat domain-containing protein [Gemmataceae bacterium]|nr:HEAT repeat domain-containing protein [Gemmataceae bacterium]